MKPLFLLLITSTLFAAEMKVRRDVAYAKTEDERQTLDVYSPAEGEKRPIVVWIHGGAWRIGRKEAVQGKPQAFVDRGFVFVATNYRLRPDVAVKEMAGDIAKAILWARENAAKFGGDEERIIVAGHSAGAHLAALVCTDERYLKAEGLSLENVKACIPVDTGAYDIAARLKDTNVVARRLYENAFGKEAAQHRFYSPMTYVEKEKGIPPFLILHVADRVDSTEQSRAFAKKLTAAGVSARVFAAADKTHATINRELGEENDPPTKAVFEFLKATVSGDRQE